MFAKKREEPATGFSATLKLPKYIPKEEVIGKAIFDCDLHYIGRAVDWTYTSSGIISLIVSSETVKEMLKEAEGILVPFEYIERVGDFILLSKPLNAFVKEEAVVSRKELVEKVAIEKPLEGEFNKPAEKSGNEKKKDEKRRKSITELEREVIENLIPKAVEDKERPPLR